MRAGFGALMLLTLACGPALAGDLEFVVIGDTRPRFESESFRPFEALIPKINAAKPAFIVNLGDLIYGYGPISKEKQWNKYAAVVRSIEAPYYQVPGNHDTLSKEARRIYARRFGKFYQSFDSGDCHFVLLDNTEEERWGYLGQAQLDWLRRDLQATRARHVFVFLHFPVWEPERITPEYYELWAQTLHPLFKGSRVRAVFAGHYHTYGPTREFDGIRYFITGGGGAELRPDYRKSGGEYHFVKVKVSGERFDVRVVTERGELSDPEADVMGGLLFAAGHVSRIGIRREGAELPAEVSFNVAVRNPYPAALSGEAVWLVDASGFAIEPQSAGLQIPAGATRQYTFRLKRLQPTVVLESLPRLQFNVVSGGKRHRFHRDVRFLERAVAPYQARAPAVDGLLADWSAIPALKLGSAARPDAEMQSCYDRQSLYLAVSIPKVDTAEAKELGFSDDLQVGLARRLSATDFSGDLLRLGFNSQNRQVLNRTPGRKSDATVPGVHSVCCTGDGRAIFEIAIPLRLLKGLPTGPGNHLVLDLSFPAPESEDKAPEPGVNTFSYRVRYGSDSLVPVYFIELGLERKL